MENEENVVRLAKPQKKGILKLVFSRFILIFLLFALELVMLVSGYFYLTDKFPSIVYIWRIFSLVMVVYLFNCSMDNSAKLTWMLLISILPVAGTVFLLFTQTNVGHRMTKKLLREQIDLTRSFLPQPQDAADALADDPSGSADLSTYLCNTGCFPLFRHTAVTYFPSGEDKFAAMLEELAKAEKFIFMEYFIVEEGYMWGKILDVLIRKAKAGVDVRVMYDGMCEMSTLPADYRKLLEKEGIRAKSFSPIRPILSSQYNYRDHRKILVIDGKVAFNGGVNLADEYINRIERFGHWKDMAIMLKGEAVKSFTLLFLQMWNIGSKEPDYERFISRETDTSVNAAGFVMPYGDSPLDGYKVGEAVYMDILNRAETYVHIMTPYLILDGELETALRFCAQRGVDVKMILPGIPDKSLPYALAKSHYKALLDSGVKIYEYTPGFVHAKVFVSDDVKAVVGTINLDYRSLYHHFECATYMYRTDCIADVEADFQQTLAQCRTVTEETVKNEKFTRKLAGTLAKFIAPLL